MSRSVPAASFQGWRVVGGAFTLAVFGWGTGFYGPPVFLHAVREARDWPLALISAAVTTHFVVGAIVVANLPGLYRRIGNATVTKSAALASAIGIVGWSIATAPWQLFAATLISGAGWAGMGGAAVNQIISAWFVRERPAALAMAYNGASVGGIVFSPLWVAAIDALSFAWAAAAIGLVMTVTIWLLSDRLFARTPQQMGLLPDGEAPRTTAFDAAIRSSGSSLWRDPKLVTLALAMALSLFAQVGLIAHLFSLLVPALGAALAGFAMGAATAAAIAGRTLVGWLMPASADRRLIACASYAVQIAGAVAFILAGGGSVPSLLVGVLLFGIGIGNATSLPPLIAQAEFAEEEVPRVVALIIAGAQATYAFAPAVFGLIRELTLPGMDSAAGAAPALFATVALLQALAICVLLSGRRARSA